MMVSAHSVTCASKRESDNMMEETRQIMLAAVLHPFVRKISVSNSFSPSLHQGVLPFVACDLEERGQCSDIF